MTKIARNRLTNTGNYSIIKQKAINKNNRKKGEKRKWEKIIV